MAIADARAYTLYMESLVDFASFSERLLTGTALYASLQALQLEDGEDPTTLLFDGEKTDEIWLYSPECLSVNVEHSYVDAQAGMAGDSNAIDQKTAALALCYLKVDGAWQIASIQDSNSIHRADGANVLRGDFDGDE